MSRENTKDALGKLTVAGQRADSAIKKIVAGYAHGQPKKMYEMLEYFFGYRDTQLRPTNNMSGKRFRSALCLVLADFYGTHTSALAAAAAIEIFHNFTLIHDDIEDGDAVRRNRPTVWKLFGVNHAINAGDALLLIAGRLSMDAAFEMQSKQMGIVLFTAFQKTIDGQYLDFELSEIHLNQRRLSSMYKKMIFFKTAALLGASAQAAGIAAKITSAECDKLRRFGVALGMAYQIADDYHSFWSSTNTTGKDSYGDIRERKRTLPFLYALESSAEAPRVRSLYEKNRPLTSQEIQKVLNSVSRTTAHNKMLDEIRKERRLAHKLASQLSLPSDERAILKDIVDALVPDPASSL